MSLFCNNGHCPQCLGEEKQVSVQLNSDDFWECPNCHLQILGLVPVFSIILPWRGKGEYRENKGPAMDLHDTMVMGHVKTQDGFFDADTKNQLSSRKEILSYISENVFETYDEYESNS